MVFLWVMGVEGSGHHMVFDAIFDKFKSRDNFFYESDGQGKLNELHSWFSTYFDHATDFARKKFARSEINRLLSAYAQLENSDELILFDRVSSPYNNPRDTLRRWDILEFIELVKPYATPRLLVLLRNPANATFSCLRRGFTNNISLQSKIIEDNYLFINSQVGLVEDSDMIRMLDYDAFFEEPEFFTRQLANWLDLPAQDLANDSLLNKPKQVSDIPEPFRTVLSDFFTRQRQSQWRALYESAFNFSNLER